MNDENRFTGVYVFFPPKQKTTRSVDHLLSVSPRRLLRSLCTAADGPLYFPNTKPRYKSYLNENVFHERNTIEGWRIFLWEKTTDSLTTTNITVPVLVKYKMSLVFSMRSRYTRVLYLFTQLLLKYKLVT